MLFLQQISTLFLASYINYELTPEAGPRVDEGLKKGGEGTENLDAEGLHDKARRLSLTLGNDLDTSGERVDALNGKTGEEEQFSFGNSDSEAGNKIESGEDDMPGSYINIKNLEGESRLGEKVLSPSEIKLIENFKIGEIDFSNPGISHLAEELGMQEVLKTARIDGLNPGEASEEIEKSTPEMLVGSQSEIAGERHMIEKQIASLPSGSPERITGERRLGFLEGFLKVIEHILDSKNSGVPFNGADVVGDKNIIGNAGKYTGIHERSGEADKFLMGMARSARQTPWCAGFVSYVLKESGYNITPTLSSKAFINQTGKGHVAFYAGNDQMLGGNQSDQVSLTPIKNPVAGWIMPEDLEARKQPQKGGTPPIGAIIVFDRNSLKTA